MPEEVRHRKNCGAAKETHIFGLRDGLLTQIRAPRMVVKT